MTESSLGCDPNLGRRELLTGIVSTSTITITGCGDSRNDAERVEQTADSTKEFSDSGIDVPDEVQQAKQDIQNVFHELANLPIFHNDEFVFDVDNFEEEFDHRKLKITAEAAITRLERTSSEKVSQSRIESLITSAEIGRWLIAQRVMIHQTIAAGLNLERRIALASYNQGLEVVNQAFQFFENIRISGEKIEQRLPAEQPSEISIEAYRPSRITKAQKMLVKVVSWSTHIFEAFRYVLTGLKKYEEGNAAIESAQYEAARSAFSASEEQFGTAEEYFAKAQRRGRHIPHLLHLAEGLRCLLPSYLVGLSQLQFSMQEFQQGNEEKAKQIARDAFSSANKKAQRCL